MKFLWVFTEEDKENLIKRGYKFINSISQKEFKIYQFKNDNKLKFDESVKFKYSNLMLF